MDELKFLTLDEIKGQLRVDFDDDDAELTRKGAVAENMAIKATRRTLDELKEMGGGEVPPEIREAALMLAGHLYRVRENVSGYQQYVVPYAFEALVKPFVRLVARDESGEVAS